jgi:hypothetical protein
MLCLDRRDKPTPARMHAAGSTAIGFDLVNQCDIALVGDA